MKLPLAGASLLFAASCGIGIVPDLDPQGFGDITRSERDDLLVARAEVCSRLETPGHVKFTSETRRIAMVGHYFLDRSPATGLDEVGQIALEIDFPGGTESPPRTHTFDVEELAFTRVTGFPAARVDASVGWTVSLTRVPTAEVRVTEPVGADPIPAAMNIDAEGRKTQVVDPGSGPGAGRAFTPYLQGTFVQEAETGIFPFAVCGDVRNGSVTGPVIGTFYLEEG